MSDDTPYRPIACEIYSQLELHIMHKDSLRMTWQGEGNIDHMDTISPIDLKSIKDHGEYLYAVDSQGAELRIRLDHILQFEKC